MQVHVLMEPMLGPQLPAALVLTVTYRELHSGSSRVPIYLCNLGAHTIEIPTRAIVGQVVPCQPGATSSPCNQDYQGVT